MKKNILIPLLFILSLNVEAQTLNEVISNIFKNNGSEASWMNISTIYSTGKMSPNDRSADEVLLSDYDSFKKYEKGNKFYNERILKTKRFITATDGTYYWYSSTEMGKPDLFNKFKRGNPSFESSYPCLMLSNYKSKGHKVAFKGKVMVKNKQTFKLEVVMENGSTYYLYFDEKTYYPVLSEFNLMFTTTDTYFSNYKKVDGIMFPFTLNTSLVDKKAVSNIETIQINTKISDSLFTPIK